MEKRPRIKINLKKSDLLIEIFTCCSLVLLWLITIFKYNQLPSTIATHFNLAGKADGYGSKSELFTLPIIGTVIFFIITILNKYPHIFNYPVNITNANALTQYTMATRMLRYLKLVILLIFLFITIATINMANNQSGDLSLFFVPLCIITILAPTIFFIIKAFKKNQSTV